MKLFKVNYVDDYEIPCKSENKYLLIDPPLFSLQRGK